MRPSRSTLAFSLSVLAGAALCFSCGTSRKLSAVQERQLAATINLPNEEKSVSTFRQVDTFQRIEQDTITVNIDGTDMLIMKAVRDDETGEMVATQELKAAVVTARFRNVAERHGRVDIQFELTVPREMQDPEWQLRFTPDMYVMGDSTRLESVIITGEGYRHRQLRGYERYNRFLASIISDTTRFVNLWQLELFLKRNIPDIYWYKTDSAEVTEAEFMSHFGVSEQMAMDHYTNVIAKRINEHRRSNRDKMYRRYVKAPIVTDGVRLDTIIRTADGDFKYVYTESIAVKPQLRKVDVVISGDIYQEDRNLYVIPRSAPLTFYISSLSSFVDNSERYLTKVIERRAEANAAWNIDFRVGKADIDPVLGDNAAQIGNIRDNLLSLLTNETFELDSITIAASASPEGALRSNDALSARRAAAAADYFNAYVRHVQDSLREEAGLFITVGDDLAESGMTRAETAGGDIRFRSRSAGENWPLLGALVERDTVLTTEQKESYARLVALHSDVDLRERALQREPYYKRLREALYPRLRTVQFQFALHRRGMVKDTVHTTVLDSTYMRGVQAIRDRDYETAAALLMPYADYNTAIAYVCLDRNASAMAILEKLHPTAPVNYMLAVLYARRGDDRSAVEHYLRSCRQDGSYVHRGNLDPEIAELIRKYNLNAEPEDEWGDLGY